MKFAAARIHFLSDAESEAWGNRIREMYFSSLNLHFPQALRLNINSRSSSIVLVTVTFTVYFHLKSKRKVFVTWGLLELGES